MTTTSSKGLCVCPCISFPVGPEVQDEKTSKSNVKRTLMEIRLRLRLSIEVKGLVNQKTIFMPNDDIVHRFLLKELTPQKVGRSCSGLGKPLLHTFFSTSVLVGDRL